MQKLLLIGLGGVAGTFLRYGLTAWTETRWQTVFPYGTVFVNLSGCFAAGFLIELFDRLSGYDDLRLALMTGFLGAFTTYSAFALQTVALGRSGAGRLALLNVVVSIAAGVAAVWFGAQIGRRAI